MPSERAPHGRRAEADSPPVAGRVSWVTWWAVLSVLAVLGQAVLRLGRISLEAFTEHRLEAWQWAAALVWLVFMVHSEGYRGFHRAFSPRVVARALHLGRQPRLWLVLLAPAYCMSLVHASRKRQITSWILLTLIVGAVTLVRGLSQPYRGIVDLGVVAGLAFGMVSIGYYFARGLRGLPMPVGADLPDGESRPSAVGQASERP